MLFRSMTAALRQTVERDCKYEAQVREAFGRLQAQFDQETEEFLAEHGPHRPASDCREQERQSELFMQHAWESFEAVAKELLAVAGRRSFRAPHGLRAHGVIALNP